MHSLSRSLITKIATSIFVLLLSFLANFASSYLLSLLSLNSEPVGDLLLNYIPRIGWTGYVADVTLVLIALVIFDAYRRVPFQIPFVVYSISSILFVRSVLILLTPVGNSFGNIEYGDFFSFGKLPSGMFPSGHTAFAFLGYLLVRERWQVGFTRTAFALMLVEISSLISSHGHYSIDIVGGLMLAYITYRLGQDYLTRKQ